MGDFHMRRTDREMQDREELMKVLRGGAHMTLALSKEDEPYLVTLNYSLDEARHCLYFHCASQGRKVEILRSNPRVWGQVLEDHGYMQGECDHSYATVQFSGRAEFVTDIDEKRRALELMIDRLDHSPDKVRQESLHSADLKKVTVCRVSIETMTGKHNVVHRP
jgi:nitroimidazol reductase NimA-like FMN-containing flavoprotein (pyridoxamine 5'-phosphate oxidase superfamily)